jgi:hypothetical protein
VLVPLLLLLLLVALLELAAVSNSPLLSAAAAAVQSCTCLQFQHAFVSWVPVSRCEAVGLRPIRTGIS